MTRKTSDLPLMSGQGEVLWDLLGILYRRRVILGLAFLICTVVASAVSLAKAPVYEAASTLIADKSAPIVLLPSTSGQSSSLVQQPLAQAPDAFTLTELAKSEAVRDAATARLTPPLDPMHIKDILSKGVRVQQVRTTELVRVSARDRDPQVAAAVANAVAASVVDQDLRARRRQATIAREFIGGQLEVANHDLRASNHALAAFKKESRDVSLSDQTQLNLRKLADLEAELADVRQQGQQADIGYTRPLSGPRPGTAQAVPDPVISTLQSQLASLEVEYSGLRKQFTPLHPQVVSTQAKIDETQRRLADEIARKRAALTAREQSLAAEASKLEQTLMQVPTSEALLARFTLDTRDAERNYMLLSEKFQEARIAEGSIGSSVRIVDVAKVPMAPVGPERRASVIFGMLVGLLMGVGAAFAMEQGEHTVGSITDAERLVGAPALGALPFLRAREAVAVPGMGPEAETRPVLLTQFDTASDAAEGCRMLRTRLIQAMRTVEAKCLLITSALPGEGKSTVVATLAIAAAQTDRHVWLLDCNLRHPTLSHVFPEALSPGLSACLAGHAALDDVVRPTRQPRLSCVVSGAQVANPAELLDTQLMTRVLDQARARADVVLLDCPATNSVTDAEVVGLKADAAVFVVRPYETDRLALGRARQRLNALGIRVLGVVVNHTPRPVAVPVREIWKEPDLRTRVTMLLANIR